MPGLDNGPSAAVFIVAAVVLAVITLAVLGAAYERKRFRELLDFAHDHGWQPVADQARLPSIVAKAERSGRSKLFLHHQDLGVWVSWHHWTETTTSSSYNSTLGRSESSSTTKHFDLTRYFLALPGSFPEMSVERRTKVGAFFKPRRGVGTGVDDFDRRFVVKPTNNAQAAWVINARVSQGLMAGSVPPFEITGNVLCTSYDDAPAQADLQSRAQDIVHLEQLLTSR